MNKNIRICDLGFSGYLKEGALLNTSCGSPNYAAPELINGGGYEGTSIDVWSLGVVLYAMIVKRLPFDDDNLHRLYHLIYNCKYIIPSNVDSSARDLIIRMLMRNPKERISVREILNHKWLQNN
jgi:serine/threonine protein kinase